MGPRPKRLIAGLAAAAALLGGLGIASMADAAEPATGASNNIRITSPSGDGLARREFKAYRLTGYTDATYNGNSIQSLSGVKASDRMQGIIRTALTANSITPSGDANGPENTLMRLKLDNASQLYRVVKSLESGINAASGLTPITATGAADATSVSIPTTEPGLYLILADGSQPMLVGTTADGHSFAGQTLGTATLKSADATGLDKKLTNVNGVENASIAVGDTAKYTITFNLPDATAYQEATLDDTMTGQTLNWDTVRVSPDAGTKTPSPVEQGFSVGFSDEDIRAHSNARVTITYTATITNAKADNTAVLHLRDRNGGDHDSGKVQTHNGGTTDGARLAELDLTKVDAGDTSRTLGGAKFTLQDVTEDNGTPDDKYIKDDDGTITRQDAPYEYTSDARGRIGLTGLAEGRYRLVETRVPDGHVPGIKAEADVTVTHDGAITVTGTGLNSGLIGADTDSSAQKAVFTVQNLSSLTQLPATGGTGMIAIALLIALIAGVGAGLTAVGRGRMRASKRM